MSRVYQNINPPPPLRPASVPLLGGGGWGGHIRRAARGVGDNILEDERHRSALLSNNLSTSCSLARYLRWSF
jgi:hypothetical protein